MTHLDAKSFVEACRRKIRESVNAAALREFLSTFRNSGVDDGLLPFEMDAYHGARRFLHRFGFLAAESTSKKNLADIERFVRNASRESGVAPIEICALLHLFADGDGALDFAGICRDVPACERCNLSEACRFRTSRRPAKLPENERPAVRLRQEGEDVLTSAELLSVLMAGPQKKKGKPPDDAERVELARRLLAEAGGLSGVAALSVTEMSDRTGLTLDAAATVKAAFAVGRQTLTESRQAGVQFRNGEDFFARYGPMLKDRKQEVFISALLDTKNRLIRDETVSQGTLNETLVHPREVFNAAIRESANSLALIHNHPSGDPSPSKPDRELTDRLVEVGRLVGIRVLDHIIVGDGRFFSFVDSGLI